MEKENSGLQEKLQASQSYTEKLEQKIVSAEAEKDGLQQKASDANDLIMQHLLIQVCLFIMLSMINILTCGCAVVK